MLDLASTKYRVLVKFEFQITNYLRAKKIMNLQVWKINSARHLFDAKLCAKYSARWCGRKKYLVPEAELVRDTQERTSAMTLH